MQDIDLTKLEELSDKIASPEFIFAGKYPILNANLFKAGDNTAETDIDNAIDDIQNGSGTSIIKKLREAVSGMYVWLRNICAIVLLCLLIYTGIRIVLASSMPEEQSKWRAYLVDWIKALALLIFIHLIMIAIFNMTDLLANALTDALGDGSSISQILREQCWLSLDFVPQAIALIMYGYCTFLTIVFAFAYFKRVLWTAILIILAPIVSALYAIGGQGKTIYKGWFKEFLVNCLIQPFHVLIYYILIMIPVSVAAQGNEVKLLEILVPAQGTSNLFLLIYCLIAMSLMRPAEKFIRNMFGMNGGKIANTASYDSGKQWLDAIGNAIKQGIITATTVGAAVATGGATAAMGNAANVSQLGQTANRGAEAAVGGNNPLEGLEQGLGDNVSIEDDYGSRRLVFPNADNQNSVNNQGQPPSQGSQENAIPEGSQEAQGAMPQGTQVPNQQLSGIHAFTQANSQMGDRSTGRLDSLADRLINRVGGKYFETPEKAKATFDAIDKLYELKHMVGDAFREAGDLEAGPGHRPMRMTPFLRERANNQFAEEEKQLNAEAERFANDDSVINYYKEKIKRDKNRINSLIEDCTRHYTDKDGLKHDDFDQFKFDESLKKLAQEQAKISSEFVKYGYTDYQQIDYMRENAKKKKIKNTEDVITYNENYNALVQASKNSGSNLSEQEIKVKVENEIEYLSPSQNVQGALIPPKIAAKEKMPRENPETLKKLAEIGEKLGSRVNNANRVYESKQVYTIIQRGKNGEELKNMEALDEDLRRYIEDEIKKK